MRQLTNGASASPMSQLSKLPMRQLTLMLVLSPVSLLSKLPMRQLTGVDMMLQQTQHF